MTSSGFERIPAQTRAASFKSVAVVQERAIGGSNQRSFVEKESVLGKGNLRDILTRCSWSKLLWDWLGGCWLRVEEQAIGRVRQCPSFWWRWRFQSPRQRAQEQGHISGRGRASHSENAIIENQEEQAWGDDQQAERRVPWNPICYWHRKECANLKFLLDGFISVNMSLQSLQTTLKPYTKRLRSFSLALIFFYFTKYESLIGNRLPK